MGYGSQMPSLYSDLIAYWPLHELSGTRFEATGKGYNLTDNATVTQNIGPVENAAEFTAANLEYLSIADNADLRPADIDMTLAGWVYPTAAMSTGKPCLFRKYAVSNDYLVMAQDAAGHVRLILPGASDFITASQVLTGSTWNFVVAFHDATANIVGISVNAQLPETVATGGAANTGGAAAFEIGRDNIPTYTNGRIAEEAFWKRRLTQQEIVWLYNNGKGRTYPFDGRISPAMLGRGHAQTLGRRRNRLVGMIG